MERCKWIDIARGIGILLVVLGHTNLVSGNLYKWIFSFHMPLFFIISGFCYKDRSIIQIARRRFKSLILPYLACSLLYLTVDIIIGVQSTLSSVKNYAITILLGENEGLWFLVALFTAEIFFCLVMRIHEKDCIRGIVVIFMILLGLVLKIDTYRIRTAFLMLPFLYIGYCIKKYDLFQNHTKQELLIVGIFTEVLACVLFVFNESVDVRIGQYGNWILFYIVAVSGCIAVFIISYFIGRAKILEVIGKNTLCIYALNAFVPTRLAYIGGIFSSGILRKIVSVIVMVIAVAINQYRKEVYLCKMNKKV